MKLFKCAFEMEHAHSHTALSVLQKLHTIHVNATVGMGMHTYFQHTYICTCICHTYVRTCVCHVKPPSFH